MVYFRTLAREKAFILIFEKLFNPENSFEDMKALAEESDIFTKLFELEYTAEELAVPSGEGNVYGIDDFAELLYRTVEENAAKIDELISKYSRGWKIERLSKVVVSILRLAVAEIIAVSDVPDSVSANEAVELTKKYGSNEDAAFVNGVLGSIIRGKEPQC